MGLINFCVACITLAGTSLCLFGCTDASKQSHGDLLGLKMQEVENRLGKPNRTIMEPVTKPEGQTENERRANEKKQRVEFWYYDKLLVIFNPDDEVIKVEER